tara:strand:- start:7270 stop:8499 length:1230 start_codon:yes stop_codon:yes gene_type:complete
MGQSRTHKKVIYFDIAKYELTKEQNFVLNSWVDSIGNKTFEILIEGYADTVGSYSENMRYSKMRAESVAEFFKNKLSLSKTPNYRFYGEDKNPFNNSNENRRCVIISLTLGIKLESNELTVANDNDIQNEADSLLNSDSVREQKFENDTVLRFPLGTEIEIDAKTFYPVKIKDVRFEVTEIYGRCDMLNNNTTTRSRNGDCLVSAGMLFVKAIYDGVEIQPNKEKYVRIKLPTNGKVVDNEMSIYARFNEKDGEIIWDTINSKLTYSDDEATYYLFETDTLFGFNLDKPIGVKCEKNGPIVKIPKLKEAMVVQLYPGENYLAVAEQKSSRKFVLDELKFDNKPYLIVIGKDKYDKPFIANGNFKDLPKKDWLWTHKYLVKKSYFQSLLMDYTGQVNLEDYMCEVLNKIE